MTKYLFVIFAGFVAVVVFALSLGSILKASDTNYARALYYPNVVPSEYVQNYSSPTIPDMQRLVWHTRHNDPRARDSLVEIYFDTSDVTHIVRSFREKAIEAIQIQLQNTNNEFLDQFIERCPKGDLHNDLCSSLIPQVICMCDGPPPLKPDIIVAPLPALREAARSIKWL